MDMQLSCAQKRSGLCRKGRAGSVYSPSREGRRERRAIGERAHRQCHVLQQEDLRCIEVAR